MEKHKISEREPFDAKSGKELGLPDGWYYGPDWNLSESSDPVAVGPYKTAKEAEQESRQCQTHNSDLF